MTETTSITLDASFRVHATEIAEYVLRGNGRRIVPKAIYRAAWEIQYALNRTSNSPIHVKTDSDAAMEAL